MSTRGFVETDYAALLDAAHQQLDGPIVLFWGNLNTHISAAMRKLMATREWLHVIRLPPYAPDLNPAEQDPQPLQYDVPDRNWVSFLLHPRA